MTSFRWIAPKALRLLHVESLSLFGGLDGIRDEGLLASALSRAENLNNYHPEADIADLAASYAYGLVKNHPFVDGNKRASFLAVGLFLGLNGYRLNAAPVDAIQAVLALASGELPEEGFALWIRERIEKQ